MKTRLKLRLAWSIATVALQCAATASADAQYNRNASLNWVRSFEADGCTSARGVAQRVEGFLRSDDLLDEENFTFVPSGSGHIAIEGYVSSFRDGWQVAIAVSQGDSKLPGIEFVQRSRSCVDLEMQAALVISQVLDSPELSFVRPKPRPAPKPAPVVPLARMAEVTASQPKALPRNVRRDIDALPFRLLVGGALDRGVYADTGLGGTVGLQVEPPNLFPMELDFAVQSSTGAVEYADGLVGIAKGASATQRGARVAVIGCPASWRKAIVGILGCAGFGYSAVVTELVRFRNDEREWVSWLGLEVSVRPTLQVASWLQFWVDASASLSIIRSSPFIAELGSEANTSQLTLYRAPQQTSRLALGFAYSL